MPASKTMNKAEVIEFLERSKRSVESYVSGGRLAAQYEPGPNGKTLVFQRETVEAFKRDLNAIWEPNTTRSETAVALRAAPRLAVVPAAPAAVASPAGSLSGSDPFAALAAHLASLAAAFPKPAPVLPGPFVGLAAAVKLSGMPAAWLIGQAKSGVPWAQNVGTAKRARWRFAVANRKP